VKAAFGPPFFIETEKFSRRSREPAAGCGLGGAAGGAYRTGKGGAAATFGRREAYRPMTEPMRLKGRDVNAAESKKAEEGGLWETIKVIAQAVVIAIVIRTVLFQPFNIPSGSLIPTLDIGDYLFVSKYAYGYSHFSLPSFLDWLPKDMPGRLFASQPKRGDVIVFKLPSDGETDYIKRLIGLPGDKIQVVHGRLIINGQMVPREPLPPYQISDRSGSMTEAPHYLETLPGGVKHEIIQIDGDNGFLDNTDVYEVPPGHYFMMGDNRDNSTDSRVPPGQEGGVGYVPFENLIGKAEIIFFSVRDDAPAWQFWRWPWTVRWKRLFMPVH
jgi:signal peptidase I